MRGFGESDKPVGKHHYALPALASDTAAVVRALGHDRRAVCVEPAAMSVENNAGIITSPHVGAASVGSFPNNSHLPNQGQRAEVDPKLVGASPICMVRAQHVCRHAQSQHAGAAPRAHLSWHAGHPPPRPLPDTLRCSTLTLRCGLCAGARWWGTTGAAWWPGSRPRCTRKPSSAWS